METSGSGYCPEAVPCEHDNMISTKEQETRIFEQLKGSQRKSTPRRSLVKTVLLWVVALWTDL